jgi:uncharacterized membrane protein YedE/YeeE
MVTFAAAFLLVAGIYVGLTYGLRNRTAFFVGVAVTLALWGAPLVVPPSYVNALYILLGVIGSIVFGLTGTVGWWRSRAQPEGPRLKWLLGATLAVLPLILFVVFQVLS